MVLSLFILSGCLSSSNISKIEKRQFCEEKGLAYYMDSDKGWNCEIKDYEYFQIQKQNIQNLAITTYEDCKAKVSRNMYNNIQQSYLEEFNMSFEEFLQEEEAHDLIIMACNNSNYDLEAHNDI